MPGRVKPDIEEPQPDTGTAQQGGLCSQDDDYRPREKLPVDASHDNALTRPFYE